jgi:DEAD/DEAH box helicase domain-containing protein
MVSFLDQDPTQGRPIAAPAANEDAASPIQSAVATDEPSRRIEAVLAGWRRSGRQHHVVAHRSLPPTAASGAPLPAWVDPRLARALADRGVSALYSHQHAALQAAHRGDDLVIATPTASGKTLCYNLPVLQALLADPRARALYLFPTKALARDQVEAARGLINALHLDAPADAAAADAPRGIGVSVYDGDTPPDQRRAARRRARILATNPDMLHAGILPHHPSWRELFAGLRYIVVDELHTYRGVFGSHVANVLRRLMRIAAFHGAAPQFIATSATIGNPEELAAQLFGRPATCIRQSGAPTGARHVVVYNPPVVDRALGLRQNYLEAACTLTRDIVRQGLSTLVFCRSRLAVEVLVRYLRDALDVDPAGDLVTPGHDPANVLRVRGYRGGYLPDRRRGVEQALREGAPDVVVATSALELGIDIGALDAVVIAGWPGSRAAVWQRSGRAGRRLAPSLTALVASSEPVDQFVAEEPDYLFGQGAEHARVDPENTSVLVPHLKCAAFELPFATGDRYGELEAAETNEVLELLADAELLHQGDQAFHYVGGQYPANEVSLRGRLDENFLVVRVNVATAPGQPLETGGGEVIAEVAYDDAPETLHPHAIYQLEGAQYLVERLDHDAHRAYVRAVEIDYYTSSMLDERLRVLERLEQTGDAAHGEIHVTRKVVGFKKIKLHTHENLGYGEVDEPEREMHTTACWFTLPAEILAQLDRSPEQITCAAQALSVVLHSSAALLLMSDRSDLGRAIGDANAEWLALATSRRSRYRVEGGERPPAGQPVIVLYDTYPGGTGLAERLFDERLRLLELAAGRLERCDCPSGCPACAGPGSEADDKLLARQLAQALAKRARREREALSFSGSFEGRPPSPAER